MANKKEKKYVIDNAKLMAEWDFDKNNQMGIFPDKITCGSSKKVWWKCSKGHEWKTTVEHRIEGTGCPICSGKKVLVGYNDLQTVNPQLAKEWHPTRNGKLTPMDVTVGSNKKVWWLGKCGHEWQANINDRNSGRNCPICSGKKVLVGYNDLETVNPKLAAEWHPYKNGDLTPKHVTKGSDKKVWWLGECGHEWQAVVGDRNSGTNCPYCKGKKILVGYNDLETVNPRLAAEWHPIKNEPLKPSDVTSGSNKKVWWLCSVCGNEWQAVISGRATGRGCPKCAIKIRKQTSENKN